MQDCAPSVTVFVGVEKDAAPKPEREPVSAAAKVRTDIVFFMLIPLFHLPSHFPVRMQ
ncbi:hypothetical protein K3370_10245 [Bacillus paralicheniformis]|nr:hypothetical protein [Bacillus paralicheniformis]